MSNRNLNVSVRPEATVLHQIGQVTDKGGSMMQRAESKGLQQANRRGLINSNMAVESAENSVYNYALPIAQQDAGTHFSADAQNAQWANQRSISDANNAASLSAASLSASTQMSMQQAALAAEARNMDTRFAQQKELDTLNYGRQQEAEQLRFDNAKFMENLGMQNQRLMQASASASAIYSNANNAIANILGDPNTTTSVKQQLVNQINTQLEKQIQMVGAFSDINTGTLLQFAA